MTGPKPKAAKSEPIAALPKPDTSDEDREKRENEETRRRRAALASNILTSDETNVDPTKKKLLGG